MCIQRSASNYSKAVERHQTISASLVHQQKQMQDTMKAVQSLGCNMKGMSWSVARDVAKLNAVRLPVLPDLSSLVDAAEMMNQFWLQQRQAWNTSFEFLKRLQKSKKLQGWIGNFVGRALEKWAWEYLSTEVEAYVQERDGETPTCELLWNDRLSQTPDGECRWEQLRSRLRIPSVGSGSLKRCDLLLEVRWSAGTILVTVEVSAQIKKGPYHKVTSQYRQLNEAGHLVLPVLLGRKFKEVPTSVDLPKGLVAIQFPDESLNHEGTTMPRPMGLREAMERLLRGRPGLPPSIPVCHRHPSADLGVESEGILNPA